MMAQVEVLQPKSAISTTLELPPSCLEFCPALPQYFVVGTYSLVLEDGEPEEQKMKPQERRGSLVLFRLEGDDMTIVQTLSTPAGVLDLHFSPTDRTLVAVATSDGSVDLFRVRPATQDAQEAHISPVAEIAAFDPSILVLSLAWRPSLGKGGLPHIAVSLSDGTIGAVLYDTSSDAYALLWQVPAHSLEAWIVAFAARPMPHPKLDLDRLAMLPDELYYFYSGGDDSTLFLHSELPLCLASVFSPDTVALCPAEGGRARRAASGRGEEAREAKKAEEVEEDGENEDGEKEERGGEPGKKEPEEQGSEKEESQDDEPEDEEQNGDAEEDGKSRVSTIQYDDHKTHDAGVTAILPFAVPYHLSGSSAEAQEPEAVILLTGSYDGFLRVYKPPLNRTEKHAVLAEKKFDGGVWRLNAMPSQPTTTGSSTPTRDAAFSMLVLASCMHAGVRVVRVHCDWNARWSIDVVASFEEHESMCYACDVQPSLDSEGEKEEYTCVSTSFYDRRLCVWNIPRTAG